MKPARAIVAKSGGVGPVGLVDGSKQVAQFDICNSNEFNGEPSGFETKSVDEEGHEMPGLDDKESFEVAAVD